ncbi:hypothetical protein GWI33_017759 [Rhynchophorus ferrugineus]|uniref:Uncharacterized protein n=1 Tax=Rhynchophorus ferrugineus TaxID=354439 RepID=A0A834HXX6_RHYFE|nr:hypothetical protein GWI33_017759 [Rhynchophorus ferrugineus]
MSHVSLTDGVSSLGAPRGSPLLRLVPPKECDVIQPVGTFDAAEHFDWDDGRGENEAPSADCAMRRWNRSPLSLSPSPTGSRPHRPAQPRLPFRPSGSTLFETRGAAAQLTRATGRVARCRIVWALPRSPAGDARSIVLTYGLPKYLSR